MAHEAASITDLVAALEHAARTTGKLSPAAGHPQLAEARKSLRESMARIENFLSAIDASLSTADDEPMAEKEESGIESLQRGVEEWSLQTKRRKRGSSSYPSPDRQDVARECFSFDREAYLLSLDLVFQFHG